jgi:CIC family chloride channel protein
MLSGLVGAVGGLGAVLFRLMIELVHRLFYGGLLPRISLSVYGLNLGIILLPALGGLLIGSITMRFAPETRGAGVPEVMEAVALRQGRIKKRVAVLKIIASSITIGSGGSAGREGPIAQIGSTIGSFLGQRFQLGSQGTRLLVVCGLAAGIAGTYNAPLGGALFGMEVLFRGIGLLNAMPVFVAAVIGATTAAAFLGQSPALNPVEVSAWTPAELPLYILLGLICGVISVLWAKVFYTVEGGFQKLRVPSQFKPALGGLVAGALIMFYPTYGVMGVGYEGINLALAGQFTLLLLLVLGVLKLLATSFTISSGGSGGIFAPTLYMGSMFGGALGILFSYIFPSIADDPSRYALAGMAALFAGATQAPINIMVMIPEMSGDFSLLPPIMASSVTSFFVAWLFLRGSSIYTLKLERRGVELRMARSLTLDGIQVEEVMTAEVVSVAPDMTVAEFETMFEEQHHPAYPIVAAGRLLGIVTVSALQDLSHVRRGQVNVGEIAIRDVAVVYPNESVHAALDKMHSTGLAMLPVVENQRPDKILGIISRHDILQAYEIATERLFE